MLMLLVVSLAGSLVAKLLLLLPERYSMDKRSTTAMVCGEWRENV